MKNSVSVDKSFTNFNTNQEKEGEIPRKPRILVAPLDWGLGHATRCIPIVQELLAQNCDVWLAGDREIERLLRIEFPDLNFLPLQGYHIRYSGTTRGFILSIFRQLHKIRSAINIENKWLKKQVKLHNFDAVISDNRFGLYHKNVPCIFITHQLTIKSPLGLWNEKLIQRWNYGYINRFTESWVPDMPDKNNLAGLLSHPGRMPGIPVHYTGILSRLKKTGTEEKKGHLLILLSGPEPQRSILEDKLIDELVHYTGTADVVRGLPSSGMILPSTNHIRFWNHLPSGELNKKMSEAEFIISRSGYSTVMDIVQLRKKSILIPTPGQTEQEYLARHLMQNKIAYCQQQNTFSLKDAIGNAENFSYQFPVKADTGRLRETISRIVSGLLK